MKSSSTVSSLGEMNLLSLIVARIELNEKLIDKNLLTSWRNGSVSSAVEKKGLT